MTLIQCFQCHHPIYQLLEMPSPGVPVNASSMRSLFPELFPDPLHLTPMVCPQCRRFPFVIHNTGIQVLTLEGQLLP